MKPIKLITALALVFCLSSCQRTCSSWKRDIQTSNRHYHIEQYSGGKLIKEFDINTILNNQEHSDGYYWYSGDTLYEVSGDVFLYSDK